MVPPAHRLVADGRRGLSRAGGVAADDPLSGVAGGGGDNLHHHRGPLVRLTDVAGLREPPEGPEGVRLLAGRREVHGPVDGGVAGGVGGVGGRVGREVEGGDDEVRQCQSDHIEAAEEEEEGSVSYALRQRPQKQRRDANSA